MASDAVAGQGGRVDEAIEKQFNLRIRHPERTSVYEGFAWRSAALRQQLGVHFSVEAYGPAPRCRIDLCRPPTTATAAPAPLFVFIHGGYWRALDRSIFTFMARPWLDAGAMAALVGYELAPAATVEQMVGQTQAAIGWLLERAGPLGFDPNRVLICGHSAGAQLGALSLAQAATGWCAAAYVGISGVYDIEPLLRTTVNQDIRLEAAQARALSPLHRPVQTRTRYLCAAGAAETEGFRGQTQAFTRHLQQAGAQATSWEAPGRTHFDVLEDMADARAPLFSRSWALISDTTPGETP